MNFRVRFRLSTPVLLASGAFAAFGSTAARAQVPLALANGGTVTNVPITSAFGGALQGTVNTATFNTTNAGGTLAGTLYSAVYRNTNNTLDFYYQVVLDGTTNMSLDSFSLTSFSGSQLSVGQTNDVVGGAGTPFTAGSPNGFAVYQAARSGSFNNGAGVSFGFTNPNTGTAFTSGFSKTVYLRTSATNYVTSGGSAFFSFGVSANSSGPVATVLPSGTVAANAPEPGSLALMGMGLTSLGGVVARRRARK